MQFLLTFLLMSTAVLADGHDLRNITSGWEIPNEGYADQPYIVKTDDGAWLVVLTTGKGVEGATGQHVITRRSNDQGKTWSASVDVEPADGPEASYAVLLKVPSGRVYVFYNHNTDNIRRVKADNPPYKDGWCPRVDSLGHFVFKYSDDHGKSWSKDRYEIPQRDFEIDRKNPYGGKLKFFWNVGKAFSHNGVGYVPIHKVGGFGEGFFTSSEGALLRSPNILTERDPKKIQWSTLPDGDVGLRAPQGGGPIAEEQSFSVLSDGSFFVVYRTIDGHSVYSYSRDEGRTWDAPQYMRYADGRLIKHPRAANFAWKCENGKFLYWFHNHGGRFIREHEKRRSIAYDDRNPVWLLGGVETDSPKGKVIRWSQPEILLYDDDPRIRMSYPDLVEQGGKLFVTETQKHIARVHEVDSKLIEGLWNQFDRKEVSREGLLLETKEASANMPLLPVFFKRSNRADYASEDLRAGFSLDVWVNLHSLIPGQVIVENRDAEGKGFALVVAQNNAVELILNDGRSESRWKSDPNVLKTGSPQHIVAVIDGGPKIITLIVNGSLSDGGDTRQFGWGRFNPQFLSANGARILQAGAGLKGQILNTRIYGRYLRTSEAISAFRAGVNP